MDFDYSQLKAQLQKMLVENDEPVELVRFRQESLTKLETTQFPKITKFDFKHWPFISNHVHFFQSSSLIEHQNDKAQIEVRVDSKNIITTVPNSVKEQGIIITDLFSAIKNDPQIVKKYLSKVISPDEDVLSAYHAALINQGIFIYIPQNVELNSPIHLTVNFDQQEKTTTNFHLLIITGKNSRFQIIDHLVSDKKQTNPLTNFTEIIAGTNSEVNFSSLDHLAQSAPVYYQYRAAVKDYAKVNWSIGLMNQCDTAGEIDSELIGEGAFANSQLIALTTANQQLGINNRVTNHSPHSQGLINQRGVALGNSRLIFNGIGQIVHGAHGSTAEQQNRLLMMSPQAVGDANPILLIDENDVEAGHAASVGKINQEQLYYLLSRGIPKKQAQRMVIRGFLSAVITSIPDRNIRQEMIGILERKLREND
ncbi:Fe-S cluster assembly protein SufD [Limosilactobacillus agrestimuris]|uniref:Fe-S cluster assembly protein SufD n=1 Tax=Limosilactobacillus agrestimuris TaxID=2941331 RepID=UPI00203C56F9|nr:Fe-S cluster assembly protein SufD [Limosilactobacillus agrestimuris]